MLLSVYAQLNWRHGEKLLYNRSPSRSLSSCYASPSRAFSYIPLLSYNEFIYTRPGRQIR